MDAVATLQRLTELTAIAHPLRVRTLERLREPGSAASLARALGETRQKINFHLKQLKGANLIRKVGERRTGGFIEDIYQAVARSFVISPTLMWGDHVRAEAIRDQVPLYALVGLGERLQRDAATLLDRAAYDGERIASASIDTEVRFASEEDRARFMQDYLSAVAPLLQRYGTAPGAPYRLVLAVYPTPAEKESEHER
jgi:DNA-binding transcriptional ArsR family regulator